VEPVSKLFCQLLVCIGDCWRKKIPKEILIVDDEESILEETAETLTDEGYECLVANNVREAVEIIKSTTEISLILTDMQMPEETGADLIKIVQTALGKNIKFILMSGHARAKIQGNGIDLRLFPFLRKPLNVENLIEKVNSVLESN
jgi:DNA-binding NtrC family response regulator